MLAVEVSGHSFPFYAQIEQNPLFVRLYSPFTQFVGTVVRSKHSYPAGQLEHVPGPSVTLKLVTGQIIGSAEVLASHE